jgi:hypothetical protein
MNRKQRNPTTQHSSLLPTRAQRDSPAQVTAKESPTTSASAESEAEAQTATAPVRETAPAERHAAALARRPRYQLRHQTTMRPDR